MTEAPIALFEASWEVCNKVGGIYTVMTSKLRHAQTQFPGSYLGIGPYYGDGSFFTFQHEELPVRLQGLVAALEQKGVGVHYGTWLTDGSPPAVMLSWDGLVPQLNHYKKQFWERYRLDSLFSDFFDVDQPLLWSVAIGLFVEEYASLHPQSIILQAHEWMTAGALLVLDQARLPNVRSIFTTHATVLGRALSSQGVPIYAQLDTLKPAEEAERLNVVTKHQLEVLAAQRATVFTTVSEVTAEEATAFLGRPPEVIVENGIDTDLFPDFEQLCRSRSSMRQTLDEFMAAYFFPSYRFDLSRTHYHFTMGRYEIHNKGYDLHLEALGRLNTELKAANSSQTLITLILVPFESLGVRPEVASQLLAFRQFGEKLRQAALRQVPSAYGSLWGGQDMEQAGSRVPEALQAEFDLISGRLSAMSRPLISPFVLRQGDQEAITRIAHENGLRNGPGDPVKVLFFPVYLDGLDGLFNVRLYEIVSGCDLGVFASLYEPWGYTPMESVALGVPAVTSTLAGFGQAVSGAADEPQSGVFLLDRRKLSDAESVDTLCEFLRTNLDESPRTWTLRRMHSYLTAQSFSWDNLYAKYQEAYTLALGQ